MKQVSKKQKKKNLPVGRRTYYVWIMWTYYFCLLCYLISSMNENETWQFPAPSCCRGFCKSTQLSVLTSVCLSARLGVFVCLLSCIFICHIWLNDCLTVHVQIHHICIYICNNDSTKWNIINYTNCIKKSKTRTELELI